MERPYSTEGHRVEEGTSRKLAVILHADVVGSTRLVQQDEALAHERIRQRRSKGNQIRGLVGEYGLVAPQRLSHLRAA